MLERGYRGGERDKNKKEEKTEKGGKERMRIDRRRKG
jgi:hypothetical protein